MNFMDSTMLLIGRMPQYFFDNVILEQIQDVTRSVHSPVKEPGRREIGARGDGSAKSGRAGVSPAMNTKI